MIREELLKLQQEQKDELEDIVANNHTYAAKLWGLATGTNRDRLDDLIHEFLQASLAMHQALSLIQCQECKLFDEGKINGDFRKREDRVSAE